MEAMAHSADAGLSLLPVSDFIHFAILTGLDIYYI